MLTLKMCKPEGLLYFLRVSSEPFQGAYAEYNGNRITVWKSMIEVDDELFKAVSGQICKIDERGIVVACQSSKLLILEIEYEGKRMNPNLLFKSVRSRLD